MKMKRNMVVLHVFLLNLIVAGLVFLSACDNGGSGGTGITPVDVPIEDLYGDWRTQMRYNGSTYTVTIRLLSSGYTCSIPGLGYSESGTYTYFAGVATLSAYFTGYPYAGTTQVVGTATYIGNDQVYLSLNSKSDLPGNYTLTKY
jgi:hypothetical protein